MLFTVNQKDMMTYTSMMMNLKEAELKYVLVDDLGLFVKENGTTEMLQ